MVNGIILAGGNSTRMGTDKSLLLLAGKTLTEWTYKAIAPVISRCIIVSNNPENTIPNCETIPDIVKGIGPIGGIYSGLKHSNSEHNLVVSCDTPFLETIVLKRLWAEHISGSLVVSANSGQTQPLIGYYSRNLLEKIERKISDKNYKLFDLINKEHAKIVNFDSQTPYTFMNMNTPEDFALAIEIEKRLHKTG